MNRIRVFAAVALSIALAPAAFAQVGRGPGVIDPNVATEAQLKALPGLSAVLVTQILERRPFANMLELDAYLAGKSIPREKLQELYRRLFIHLNLNTAPREEILLVPGVGPRIAHEFEEYRPYRGGLPQFRKEIGKYVDKAELARLEQYVFVPINLNTASDEDILSIPGMGKRMLHEFKEYRPYKSLLQFRKEIGKYVNAREVARLERYVTLE
jgi:DNA uptake protein ComE-like DNA-binding protein